MQMRRRQKQQQEQPSTQGRADTCWSKLQQCMRAMDDTVACSRSWIPLTAVAVMVVAAAGAGGVGGAERQDGR
jgi:hypothetical protein